MSDVCELSRWKRLFVKGETNNYINGKFCCQSEHDWSMNERGGSFDLPNGKIISSQQNLFLFAREGWKGLVYVTHILLVDISLVC